MGCHTWFYRRVELTQEDAKRSCLKRLRYYRNLYWKIYKNPEKHTSVEYYYGNSVEKCKREVLYSINLLNRQIRMVEKDLCQQAVWNKLDESKPSLYIDNKLYVADVPFHDCFRKGGYPEDKLFSLQETLNYINNLDNQCTINEDTFEQLQKFWTLYPNGMIDFG